MVKRISIFWLIGLGLLSIITIFRLTRPAITQPLGAHEQFIPTPAGAMPRPPQPTHPDGTETPIHSLFAATPAPDEQVSLANIIEVVPTPTPTHPYRAVTTLQAPGTLATLVVRNEATGQAIRLGNDQGNTNLEGMSERYIIWRYYPCTGCAISNVQAGLYAYDVTNGNQYVISQEPQGQWYAELDGDWVIYLVYTAPGSDEFATLRAHNLATGEDFLVADHIALHSGFLPSSSYALQGDKIAWLDVSTTNLLSLHVYDLTSRTAQVVPTPPWTGFPTNVSVSNHVVVWLDGYYKGYDLRQQALFTIPIVPPGWENLAISGVEPVTVANEHISWGLILGNKVHRFTASLVPRR